jgi:hypothetical protein
VPLVLTLEELYTGTTKRRRVTRNILDAASGKAMPVEETLEIPVKAGWKEGTRITFTGEWVLGVGWVGRCVEGWGCHAARVSVCCEVFWSAGSCLLGRVVTPLVLRSLSPDRRCPWSSALPLPLPARPPAGKGDELPGRPAQDLVFVVRQKAHPVFEREGDDLVASLRIPIRWVPPPALLLLACCHLLLL